MTRVKILLETGEYEYVEVLSRIKRDRKLKTRYSYHGYYYHKEYCVSSQHTLWP